jgi:hypothetical protein
VHIPPGHCAANVVINNKALNNKNEEAQAVCPLEIPCKPFHGTRGFTKNSHAGIDLKAHWPHRLSAQAPRLNEKAHKDTCALDVDDPFPRQV